MSIKKAARRLQPLSRGLQTPITSNWARDHKPLAQLTF